MNDFSSNGLTSVSILNTDQKQYVIQAGLTITSETINDFVWNEEDLKNGKV